MAFLHFIFMNSDFTIRCFRFRFIKFVEISGRYLSTVRSNYVYCNNAIKKRFNSIAFYNVLPLKFQERVKMALLKQEEDEKLPHKRKRRRKENGEEDEDGLDFRAPDRNVDDHSSRDSGSGTAT